LEDRAGRRVSREGSNGEVVGRRGGEGRTAAAEVDVEVKVVEAAATAADALDRRRRRSDDRSGVAGVLGTARLPFRLPSEIPRIKIDLPARAWGPWRERSILRGRGRLGELEES